MWGSHVDLLRRTQKLSETTSVPYMRSAAEGPAYAASLMITCRRSHAVSCSRPGH